MESIRSLIDERLQGLTEQNAVRAVPAQQGSNKVRPKSPPPVRQGERRPHTIEELREMLPEELHEILARRYSEIEAINPRLLLDKAFVEGLLKDEKRYAEKLKESGLPRAEFKWRPCKESRILREERHQKNAEKGIWFKKSSELELREGLSGLEYMGDRDAYTSYAKAHPGILRDLPGDKLEEPEDTQAPEPSTAAATKEDVKTPSGDLIPNLRENYGNAPSIFLRSGLFIAPNRIEHPSEEKRAIPSPSGTSMWSIGPQLNQSHLDLLLILLSLAASQGANQIHFSGNQIASCLGLRSVSLGIRTRISNKIAEIQKSRFYLRKDTDPKTRSFDLISHFSRRENGRGRQKNWTVVLSSKMGKLFTPCHEVTYLRFEDRDMLCTSLSKYLHGWVSSHRGTENNPSMIKMAKLMDRCGYRRGIRLFRMEIRKAIPEVIEYSDASQIYLENDVLKFF